MKNTIRKLFNQNGFWLAILSVLFFSLNVPVSKFLLQTISPYWLASLLYFGAARVQMIQSFAPLTGGILAFLFFNEVVGIYTWIGYLLVMIALSMIGLDLLKKDPKSR
jgi:drug/metabolite transporter (DMT)-like permease